MNMMPSINVQESILCGGEGNLKRLSVTTTKDLERQQRRLTMAKWVLPEDKQVDEVKQLMNELNITSREVVRVLKQYVNDRDFMDQIDDLYAAKKGVHNNDNI